MDLPNSSVGGAAAEEEDRCPICEMTVIHERGCPYEGLSIEMAIQLFQAGKRSRQDVEREQSR